MARFLLAENCHVVLVLVALVVVLLLVISVEGVYDLSCCSCFVLAVSKELLSLLLFLWLLVLLSLLLFLYHQQSSMNDVVMMIKHLSQTLGGIG